MKIFRLIILTDRYVYYNLNRLSNRKEKIKVQSHSIAKHVVNLMLKYFLMFQVGGCIYYYIEVFIRGWSHWSMYLLGGLCFLFCSIQNKVPWWDDRLDKQVLRCLAFVLVGEFITGCMVNLWLGWEVWDYSNVPLNLMGQVCAPMAVFFAFLCLMGIGLDNLIRKYAFGEEWRREEKTCT